MFVVHSDNVEFLRGLPANSVDSIVTDPPYGLSSPPDVAEVMRHWLAGDDYTLRGGGFMGKSWDSFVPGPALWRECYRVLKPGGHIVSFSGSRTYHLMATAVAMAGFEIRDQLLWLYGTGFPKSMDLAKAFDRQRHDRDEVLQVTKWIRDARDAAGLTNAQIDAAFGFNGVAGHWTSQKSQPSVPTLEQVPFLLLVLGVTEPPAEIRRLLVDLNGRKGQPGANWGKRPVIGKHTDTNAMSAFTVSFTGANRNLEPQDITDHHSDEAKQWAGWGTALKPAHEPIVLARKPFAGTLIENVRQWGVGGLNIDASRVGGGRWPANLAHDGSDVVSDVLNGRERYFYHGKATREERDRGLESLPSFTGGELTGRKDGSVGLGDPRAGAGRTSKGVKNTHPTVKPIAVMRWLCRLVTPPGGLIVDPYTGSGSTGCAAVLEGFNFSGCEYEAQSVEIANLRILGVLKK